LISTPVFKKNADIIPVYSHQYEANQQHYARDKFHALIFSNLILIVINRNVIYWLEGMDDRKEGTKGW